jgi:hypothetical protein
MLTASASTTQYMHGQGGLMATPGLGRKVAKGSVQQTMHEFKHGTLRSSSGKPVTNRRQALAIALSQAARVRKSISVYGDAEPCPYCDVFLELPGDCLDYDWYCCPACSKMFYIRVGDSDYVAWHGYTADRAVNYASRGSLPPNAKQVPASAPMAIIEQLDPTVSFLESYKETTNIIKALRAAQRRRVPTSDFAGPHNSFPIRNQQDVDNAARLVGHAANPVAVRARIIAIAKRKDLKIPNAWKKDKKSINKSKTEPPAIQEFIQSLTPNPNNGIEILKATLAKRKLNVNKAANYHATGGQVIAGRLARGKNGKFTSSGASEAPADPADAGKTDAQRIAESKVSSYPGSRSGRSKRQRRRWQGQGRR